ncbi:glycosylhydrolase-like jelly roll fold domain-containing protein [Streptomyces aurantiacus]|uniref:Glycoside hydrolase n=1 Tax=Streptomyces aurantiacus TaxID=47760 RepID=A0A7G1NSY6_9ACTN|nr:glycosyl hydrolase [Streptomyces aurantiacus]BCL25571.1 glycoside hydrolase [Streptomyces aurantiacus]
MNDTRAVEIVTTQDGPGPSRRTVLALTGAAALAMAAPSAAAEQAAAAGPDASGHEARVDRFAHPRPDSSPTILWFWNGTVTADLVRDQLSDMRDKGIHEVLVFPFETEELKPRFFSEAWFSLIEVTFREAQRHGMHLWLFNDDYFPSGRAGGLVVAGGQVGDRVLPPRPEYGLKGVGLVQWDVPGGSSVRLAAQALSVIDGHLLADAQVRDGVTLLRDGSHWRDYDVHAVVRIEQATAGLMVRSPDEANGLLMDLRADGAVDVWRQREGRFDLVRQGTPVGGFDPADFHRLDVVLRGSRVQISLDGTDLPPLEDNAVIAGRVGVRATATQRSAWDALSVRDADGVELYSQSFDGPDALDTFLLPEPAPLVGAAAWPKGATSTDALIDLTDEARASGTWTAPGGQWHVALFPLRELAQNADPTRNYLNLLDDEAVDLFLDTVPGEYVRRFPWAVGTVLRGFADDEPFLASADSRPLHALPWSTTLEQELDRLGARPGPALAAALTGLGTDGEPLRGTYWRAVSNRYAAAYYRRQGAWMAKRGLRFISNPLWDEYGPAEQIRSSGNLNTSNQWAQIPGTDLIADHYRRGYHRTLSRWPASTAHQLGKERVYLEAMGATGWSVTPALTREVVGAFAVRGVNHTLLHASFSNDKQIVYPPPFQPVNPWWDHSGPLNDWIGRLMEACRAPARPHTALLQPQRAAETYQDTSRAEQLDKDFTAAAHALEDSQIDFDFLDEGALDDDPALRATARPDGTHLVVGHQKYRAVVLPRTPLLALGTAKTLRRFARGGGTVVVVGDLPARESGGDHAGLRRALDGLFAERSAHRVPDATAAATAVVSAGCAAATVSPHTDDVRVMRLDYGPDTAFVVTNEHDAAVRTTLTFPVAGTPEIWDPGTGTVTPAGVWRPAPFPGRRADGTAVDVRIEARATLLVVVRPAGRQPLHATSSSAPVQQIRTAPHGALAVVVVDEPGTVTVAATDGRRTFEGSTEVTDPLTSVPLDGDWTFRFDREGAESRSLPLGSWTEQDARHSGTADYEKTFQLDAKALAGRRWTLDLGDVRDVARVSVNGKALDSLLWAPYRTDITDALRPGLNTLHVRVTNTGANARGETLASGLIGPVTLRPTRTTEVPLRRK